MCNRYTAPDTEPGGTGSFFPHLELSVFHIFGHSDLNPDETVPQQSSQRWTKQINSKKQHSELTDLVSTGVEEVPQTDDVAVVQLSHDLQLTVLKKRERAESVCEL